MNTEDIANFNFLKSLCGANTVQGVKDWLSQNRIHHWPDAKGKPVTIRDNLLAVSGAIKDKDKKSKLKLIDGPIKGEDKKSKLRLTDGQEAK